MQLLQQHTLVLNIIAGIAGHTIHQDQQQCQGFEAKVS